LSTIQALYPIAGWTGRLNLFIEPTPYQRRTTTVGSQIHDNSPRATVTCNKYLQMLRKINKANGPYEVVAGDRAADGQSANPYFQANHSAGLTLMSV